MINNFCEDIGVSRKGNENYTSAKKLEHFARKELDANAPRVFTVLEPVLLHIVNFEEIKNTSIQAPLFPSDPSRGHRTYTLTRDVYIEREDFSESVKSGFFGIMPEQVVCLRYGPYEINRAPAKVQSALLEAMQERQVTIGTETFRMDDPFLVLATQNPIEQEGTYSLPEAQVDRFMLKLVVRYPSAREERQILDRMAQTTLAHQVRAVLRPADIVAARGVVDRIFMDERVKDYVVNIVVATRDPDSVKAPVKPLIQYGASPRATIALTIAARAKAFLDGRGYATPQDVKDVAFDVLRHRIGLSYEAEALEKTSDDVVRTLLEHVPVP